ncbi:hypothetical protein OC835_005033 [Tilletia horrida]|nr:hypothetical protein OC835_005033 [Tilletia horrida]
MSLPRPEIDSIETGLLVGGDFVKGTGVPFTLTDPGTEQDLLHVHSATQEEVDKAVKIASEAQKLYYAEGPEQWETKLRKFADLIDEHTHELAALDAICMGRPLSVAAEIGMASRTIRLSAALAVSHHGESSSQMDGSFAFTLHQPFGVCAAITPWNASVVLCASKLGPALASGNAIIIKTSERAPLSTVLLGKLALAAGFPAGVVQVLHGKGDVGAMLARHPQIRRLAFTGSTAVGRKVLQMAAESNLKKVTLELGGKGAAIVFDDANVELAVETIAFSMSWLSGQLCMAQSRVYVQRGIAEKFIASFKASYLSTPMGDAFQEGVIMGPLVDKRALESVQRVLEQAKKDGGSVSQGPDPAGKGFYMPPTIITGLKEESTVVKDEIFGPVVHISIFDTEEEALRLANDTEYGLYSTIYTQDGSRAIRCARALHVGLVGINQTAPAFDLTLPFGGMKASGMGREWGSSILDEWTEVVQVAWKLRAPIHIIAEDGTLSLAKMLELRKAQQLELQQWWNGSLPGNATWTVRADDERLQHSLPSQLQYPTFSELNSSEGEAYYWNISGYYKGGFQAVELFPLPANDTIPPSLRDRSVVNGSEPNIRALRGNFPWLDGAGGMVEIEISEDHNISPNVTMITGSLFMKSRAQSRSLWSSEVIAGASVRFDLTGVHYLNNGGLLLSALPAESNDVPDSRKVLGMLPPSILPSNATTSLPPSDHPAGVLNETWHAINETLHQEIERLTDLVGDKDPTEPIAQPADERITHNCTDFHLYLRLYHLTGPHPSQAEVQAIREYEHELFYSSGASPLGLFGQRAEGLYIGSAVFFSEKCDLIIHAGLPRFPVMEGLRYIEHRRKIMHAALCLALITLIQLRLTMGMMRRARTASARIKIDWRTLLLQTIADMYTSILCAIPAVVWRNETDLLLASVSYVVGCHFVGGEYQFLIFVVHDSQNDPLNNRPTPPAAPIPAAAQPNPEGGTNAAADNAAAATVPAEAVVDPAQQAANEHRYIGILVFFFLLNFQPLVFFSILGPVLYSFWIPQIMRNVKRGSRRPFPRKYIIGMTLCRCMMPLYFWQCPDNIFFWEPTPLVWILIGYVWLQAVILLLQDELGPAFFLPARFQPETSPSWDWHPPLSVLRKHIRQAEDKTGPSATLEHDARVDADAQSGEGGGAGGHKHGVGAQYEIEIGDCAICLSEIEPLRWDWRDEDDDAAAAAAAAAASGGEGESDDDDDDEQGGAGGDEYAYVAVDGAEAEAAEAQGTSRARRSSSGTRSGSASSSSGARNSSSSTTAQAGRRRRHLRTGSLISSWASSAVRVGRRVGRAISAAREHGGRGRSGAAAASAALGGGRTDIMVAPCHHIFHTECLERVGPFKAFTA